MNQSRPTMPPAMILCGGQGTRLRDVTELLPKPMVPIGEQPILWHIMKSFAAFGVTRFILCLGYKREEFIDYFLNFHARACDVTLHLGHRDRITYHGNAEESDWEVTLANTGMGNGTGSRVAQAARYLRPEDGVFFLTYGDAVADIDLAKLLRQHRERGKLLTVSAVHPEGRFGEMLFGEDDQVTAFTEKPARIDGCINGGFMAVSRDFVGRYLDPAPAELFLEGAPMSRAVADGELDACRHEGFWQCMDTPREYQLLNTLWARGKAPWTRYWTD